MANFLELNTEGLYRSLGKEKEIVVLCSRPPQYVKIGVSRCVQRCVVCNDDKEMYKNAKLLFCQSKPTFLPFSLSSLSSLLKLPNFKS